MINWNQVIKKINYQFDSIGTLSSVTIIDDEFGELKFHWEGNKSKIRISFIDTCVNCICDDPNDIIKCNCSWIAFHEQIDNSIVFNKKQFYKISQPTLF